MGKGVKTAKKATNPSGTRKLTFKPQKKEKKEDTVFCPICHEDTNMTTACLLDMCDHVYCKPCISRWLDKNTSCPLCRKEVTAYFLMADPQTVHHVRKFSDNTGDTGNAGSSAGRVDIGGNDTGFDTHMSIIEEALSLSREDTSLRTDVATFQNTIRSIHERSFILRQRIADLQLRQNRLFAPH